MAGELGSNHHQSLLFVPEKDPRKSGREIVDSILTDKFMAFLSVLLLPVILLPFFVSLPTSISQLFELLDTTIILFFVLEYSFKIYYAEDRWAYFKSPWHILDLIVIVLSFISYVPLVGFSNKGSAALLVRLLRLPRAFTVAGRTAGSRLGEEEQVKTVEMKQPATIIRHVGSDLKVKEGSISWEELEAHISDGRQEWIDIYNVTPEGITKLSKMLRIAEPHFKTNVLDDTYPHIDFVRDVSFVFLQSGQIVYPETPQHFLRIAKSGIVIICSGNKIISVSPHGTDLFKKVLSELAERLEGSSFTVSVLYGILDATLAGYRSILSDIETEVVKVSGMPRSKLPRDFLARMYELNKEVSKMVSNLVHFKAMLAMPISRGLPLEGFDKKEEESFQVLQGDAQMLNEVADDLADSLKSMIDLYINQEAFETNRMLKILAVITALAVIPATVSGILGQNLLDTPFNAELWQVVLGMGMAMMFALYCFIKVGWLRT